ncbi:hypothetical protein A7H1H_2144 [Aliarcobacter butzleri 7h1h]|uniref:AAA family ATPase n=1 Tax=Aliarcobacter butzleri TaxID=28197 RepID=UPI00030B684E|nr:AAA family ATPase [Aliarcobacter butzleri]AGR78386.1 hypothetical protein A7H1H_2144 [Aliarcobacter butzleri 7h1h]
MNHNWINVYEKITKELISIYTNNNNPGEYLYNLIIQSEYYNEFKSLNPWIINFKEYDVNSIDPIHIFASFNSWKITNDTRKKKLNLYYKILTKRNFEELEKYDLDIFKYFPHVQITRVVGARSNKEQKRVWDFFYEITKDILNFNIIKDKFDDVLGYGQEKNVYGVGFPLATIFMFWVNSNNFLPIDKNTRKMVDSLSNYKITHHWKSYTKTLKKQFNTSTNLYRNLTFIAIDLRKYTESKEKYFSSNEINEIKQYFSSYHGIQTQGIQPNIKNNEENHLLNDSTSNLTIIALKPLDSCNELYTKSLKKNALYVLDNSYTIKNNGNVIEYTPVNNIDLYSTEQGIKINIQAIVGKNGQGKSSLTELLAMTIAKVALQNNILQIDKLPLNEQSIITEELHKLSIQLYFKTNKLYKLHCYQTHSCVYEYELKNNSFLRIKKQLATNFFKNFFYTIYSNYSLHSLNESSKGFKWLKPLFHKNDGYQTPVVIEPYREDGTININKLTKLTKQRLISRILEPFEDNDSVNQDNFNSFTRLINDKDTYKEATHLNISLDSKTTEINLKNIGKKRVDKNMKFKNGSLEHLKNYLNLYKKEIVNIKTSFEIPNITDLKFQEDVYIYIINKIMKISINYPEFNINENDLFGEEYLKRLYLDKTHITHKLHQAINYLKFNTVTALGIIDIHILSKNIERIQQEYPEIPTIRLIPPAIFNSEIFLNGTIEFNTLSSGEKQLIYTISSVIYQLQNLSSVHKSSSKKLAYKYINIVLDEIELYFHPEYQRIFITNLLNALENFSGLEDSIIENINFILVTHSPFILSDIIDDKILFLPSSNHISNTKTFGANIHELLSNSFFMEDGLMGEHVKTKIKDIVNFFNNKNKIFEDKQKELYQLINYIGEDFIREKLLQMYNMHYKDSKILKLEKLKEEQKIIENQIKELESKND